MTNVTKTHKLVFTPLWSLIIALGIYVFLLLPLFSETIYALPTEHFYIVSLTSIIAAGISYGIGVSGIRLRNLQVLFVSLGFISLTIFFALHGLSTPGFLLEANSVVGVAVQFSFLFMGIFLWLSTLPSDNRYIVILGRRNRLLLSGGTLILIIVAIILFFNNALIDWIPLNSAPLNWIVATTTFVLASASSYRFWRAFRYTRFPLQSGLAHASILIAAAQVIASTGQIWHIS